MRAARAPGPPAAPKRSTGRLCVADFSAAMPGLNDVHRLIADAGESVLKFAVVDSGTISYFALSDLEMPIFMDATTGKEGGRK